MPRYARPAERAPVGHLLERRLAVAPIGMAVKGPREVLGRDQVGKGALLGGFDLPRVLAQFCGDFGQAEPSNKSASVRQATSRPSPESAYSLRLGPRASAGLRMAMLCASSP